MNALQINVRKLIQDKNPKLLKKLPGFVISYIERIVHEKEINTFLAEQRKKYHSLFLTNYRESKDIARKRISFELVYSIIEYLLESNF